MPFDSHAEFDNLIREIERAKTILFRAKTPQIRNTEHRTLLKSTALSWFRSRRHSVALIVSENNLARIDEFYRFILDACDRYPARITVIRALNDAKTALVAARGAALVTPAVAHSPETPPDFAALASDAMMQTILLRRWDECRRCLEAGAALAATVMMGGLLEALFVARANKLIDKSPLFNLRATPIDGKTKKALDLRQWTLGPYIDVGHEMRWISHSAKDVAGILRDYRNYVHPEKERSHGISLTHDDARMFWEVTKSLSRELLGMKGVI